MYACFYCKRQLVVAILNKFIIIIIIIIIIILYYNKLPAKKGKVITSDRSIRKSYNCYTG